MIKNAVQFFNSIIEKIILNKTTAFYFINNLKGLELIFSILNQNISQKKPKELKKTQTLIERLKSLKVQDSTTKKVVEKDQINLDEAKLTEFGNLIKYKSISSKITNGSGIANWSNNKSGRSSTIYNTTIQMHKKDIKMAFLLKEPIELREFLIGITIARSENYIVVGPPSFISLYAISENKKKIYLGELQAVNDTGYYLFNTEVYVLNPNRLKGPGYEQPLNNLRYLPKISEFEVIIGKPKFTICDKISPLCNKSFNAVNLSINFISMNGYLSQKINIRESYSKLIQSKFYEFIDKIFNSNNMIKIIDDYFDLINSQKDNRLFDMIEAQLDNFINMFTVKMSRFLLIISEKNKKMSEIVFEFLMRNIEKNKVFYSLIEKILKKTHSYPFLNKYFQFGKKKLQDDPKFGSLFLGVISNYFTHLANILKHKPNNKFALKIDKEFFGTILKLYKEKLFDYNIERFILIVLYYLQQKQLVVDCDEEIMRLESFEIPNNKLPNNSEASFKEFMSVICDKLEKGDYNYLPLFAYASVRIKDFENYLVEKEIYEKVKNMLKSDEVENIFEILLFLKASCEVKRLHELILEKEIDQLLLKYIQVNFLSEEFRKQEQRRGLLLETVFKIFLMKEKGMEELEEKIFNLLKHNYKNSFFIQNILMKFFEFEKIKKIQFIQNSKIDQQTKQIEMKENLDLNNESTLKIDSEVFTKEWRNQLQNNLSNLVDDKLAKNMQSCDWIKLFSSESEKIGSHVNKIQKELFAKKPFLLLLNCYIQSQKCVLGIFSPTGFSKKQNSEDENEAFVPNSDNTFIFYYNNEGTIAHYKPAQNLCENFLEFNSNSEFQHILFSYENQEKIYLCMLDGSHTIDLYPMKPLTTDPVPDFEFPYDVHLNSIEVFQLDIKSEQNTQNSSTLFYDKLLPSFDNKSLRNSFLSYYYEEPIFDLQEELTLKQIESCLKIKIDNEENKEKQLKMFDSNLLVFQINDILPLIDRNVFKNCYNPKFPMFEVFLLKGGMTYILEKILKADLKILTKDQKTKWQTILKNILELQEIEGFLSSMIQEDEFLKIIFELFSGSKSSKIDFVDAEIKISTLIFEKLCSILSNQKSYKTQISFLQKKVLNKLLDKLQQLTHENVRIYDDSKVQQKKELTLIKKKSEEEDLIKKVKKRKGVGYDKEGSGKKWLVNEYFEKRKQRNKFIVALIDLFNNLMDINFPQEIDEDTIKLKQSFYKTICQSCLLPLLESSFNCSSLHEMAKEIELYKSYCTLIEIVAKSTDLNALLLQLPNCYKPPQLESVLSILQRQEDNTKLFKQFSGQNKEDIKEMDSISLAEKIIKTIELIKPFYKSYFKKLDGVQEEELTEEELEQIKAMSVNEQYKKSLKDFRFGLTDMDLKKHHYQTQIQSSKQSSSQRMIRMAQEIADLSQSLPIDSYNAIFVRSHTDRLDVMKAMIAGAEGTPYGNGLFEYHVFLQHDYPNGPPKCNLETTGGGDVRFNPNLYSCGKVCLSLLGTWRGSASENWDPKISNLLQLFMSIQAVVMSEEVYFNEPGYEGEAGTEEGEKKNEGYSNIVRLCNIKYAMIKQLKTPSKGFEEVTKRHFYLKRDVIMKEVGKWIKMAVVRPCTYSGLVNDHNYKYGSRFSANKDAYLKELKDSVIELEKCLKDLVEERSIESIFLSQKSIASGKKIRVKKKVKIRDDKELKKMTDKIDITYDEIIKQEVFDADDQKVADRWSRYIGAMGIEAVKKQTKAKVVLFGMNALGLEIAKNIILSGVNKFVICDFENIGMKDLLSNFYCNEKDIGKNRSEIVLSKLQQLNFYVKVENRKMKIDEKIEKKFLEEFDVIVIADNYLPFSDQILKIGSELGKKIIVSDVFGVYMRVFVDFGNEFVVQDRDGEAPAECFIKELDYESGLLTLFPNSVHDMRTNDHIIISEAITKIGEKKELNESIHKIIDFKKKNEILIEKLEGFNEFESNGKIKQIKLPQKLSFKRYKEMENVDFTDDDLRLHDFEKMESSEHVRQLFIVKEKYEKENKKRFLDYDFEKLKKYLNEDQLKNDLFVKRMKRFVLSGNGDIHSISAFIGGVVAQEIIKGITNKFCPIKQLFVSEMEELLQDEFKDNKIDEFKPKIEYKNQYTGLEFLVGQEMLTKMKNAKLFMVGSGAIGCELLKNYACLGLGSGEGKITLTDPDSIELSNLSRQFLFREKHIGQPKSLVACKVIQSMNPDLVNKIDARLEKVCEQTEDMFDDEFIKTQTMCLNALDNIKARIYMDKRCVLNHVPLLESGTLGSKGHVQVFVPNMTENYAQVQDATEEHNIPICTLKMFPEESIHCMEWAKDRFDYYFGQNPKSFIRVVEEFKKLKELDGLDFKVLKKALRFLQRRPKSFGDCVKFARLKFQKMFYDNIKQLMHVYPLDYVKKDGKKFWTLPKRPPVEQVFDLEDKLHFGCLLSFARLLARVWGLDESESKKFDYKTFLSKVKVPEFKPKDSAIAEIKKQVEKNEKKEEIKEDEEEIIEEEQTEQNQNELKEIIELLKKMLAKQKLDDLIKTVQEEIFEKDQDENGHVDYISSLCNLRARNYKLEEMEWIQVKLKAGRIVPALATTTAAISALQILEAIKVIKEVKLEEFRSVFVNLAIPIMTFSEPGPVVKHKIHDKLEVTVWDQWEFEFDDSKDKLESLFDYVKKEYQIWPSSLFKNNKAIFFSAINKFEDFKDQKLSELLDLEKGESCYVSVICMLEKKDKKPLDSIPPFKIIYKKK